MTQSRKAHRSARPLYSPGDPYGRGIRTGIKAWL